jgi:hypothetical protein
VAILILVMLLIVWAVVLGPSLWRRLNAHHSTDSIHAFHRALRVLQRTGDPALVPVHRLAAPGPTVLRADGRPALLLVRPDSAPPQRPRQPKDASVAYFRPEACKRRRDLFVGLVASVVGTGILGALPPLRPMLVVMLLAGMALIGYVVLLVRLRVVAHQRLARARMRAARVAAAEAAAEAAATGLLVDTGEPTQQLQRQAAAR